MDLRKIFFLPENASSHGQDVDLVIYLIHGLMFVLFIGWAIYFIMAVFKFNRRAHPRANYTGITSHTSSLIEVGVVIAEVILLVGFSIPFWARQVGSLPNRPDAVQVQVKAEQFAWNIRYPGADGVFGKTDFKFFNKQSNPWGIDPGDPHGKDDITTINQLVLPIGRTAVIQLTSQDVIHSFALPVMRVKQDAIPGLSVPTWFTPTKTGEWEIACAQLCGIGHYRMKGFLKVKTQEEYDAWLAANAPAADSGSDDFWN